MKRKPIKAPEGMILTDGEIYGTKIYLAEGRSGDEFYPITMAEYEKLIEQEENNESEYGA